MFATCSDFFISQWVNMEEKYVIIRSCSLSFVISRRNHVKMYYSFLKANETDIDSKWDEPISRNACMYVYTGLIVSTIVVTLTRSVSFFTTCMKASTRLHDHMFRCISRATMRFFNTNTSGRILNRFSKDMGAIDELLPIALIDCFQIGLSLIAIIIVVAIANYWLLIPTVVIGVIFFYLRIFYLATSRSVKRLEGVSK